MSTRAAGRIEHRTAVRVEHVGDQRDDRNGREELSPVMCLLDCERRCCTARSKSLTSLAPVAESAGAVRIGHPERGHFVEYLAPNSVFNSLPRQRSSPHLGPDERLVTIDRVLHHASLGAA